MGRFSRQRRWRSQPRQPARSASQPSSGQRLVAVYALIGVIFLVLSLQLFRLQLVDGQSYRLLADGNRTRIVAVSPPRGLIVDRNGVTVAQNLASFSATIVPADVPKEREQEIFARLQEVLRVPAFEIEQKVTAARRRNEPLTPIVVKRELDRETALVLAERRATLPGVDVRAESTRVYPYGALLSPILGYTGPIEADELKALTARGYRTDDRVGKAGVETVYEAYLRGVSGQRQIEVDASGRELRMIGEETARPGQNLVLAIDLEFQQAVTDILQKSVADLNSKKAVAIAMDVRTGEVLAFVSLPSYDNNIFSRTLDEARFEALTNDPDKPLLNHGIAEKFPPGSTFKILTGLAALQEGVATPTTTIYSNGAMLVPRDYDRTQFDSFPDWRPGLGSLSFYRGVAMSSDIYFYCLAGGCSQLGEGLGSERLARYARAFGYGERTGIDLPNETEGLVGDASWLLKRSAGAERWFLADSYYLGIGQGYIEATPLQVLRMTAAVANGGDLLRPRVVREIRDAEGAIVLASQPEVQRRVPVSTQNLAVMREAMRQAVADGTANLAAVPGVAVAGKTGTAEFGQRIGAGSIYGRYREHGWFTGFAPFENPEIAVVVFHQEGGGGASAAPTAGRILRAWFDLKQQRAAAASPSVAEQGGRR